MFRNKKFIIITAVMTILALGMGTVCVSAKSLSSLQKEIKEKRAELEEGEEKEASLTKRMNELEEKVGELQTEIDKSEVRLKKLKKDLKKAEKKVDKQNEDLGSRLRNMYKNGTVGFIDVLLDSNSFTEFLTNLDLVKKIYEGDKEVLNELQAAYDEIDRKKEKVETLKAELEDSKKDAEEAKSEVESQKEAIAEDNEKTAKMLDEKEAEASALAKKLAAKAKSGEVSSSKTSKYSGGEFTWPVPSSSYISSNYGWRTCPFHGREFHAAIDIAANSGSSVLAASSGKVITSGWNGGFGNCIIVDHGGGVTTWYNHLSSRLVSVGTSVSKGQQIGKVGSTGSSTGPHLDFRVYVNGSSRNPMNYFD